MPPKPSRPPLTHFLCIPLVNASSRPQLVRAFERFRALANEESRPDQKPVIPPDAIRPIGTLHLTLGVMSLQQPARLAKAVELLKSLDLAGLWRSLTPVTASSLSSHTDETPAPLTVTLRGLESMQSPASSSRVLYAPPFDPDKRLWTFCNAVLQAFKEADLMVSDGRPDQSLKLHATVVNTIYVRGALAKPGIGGGHAGNRKMRKRVTIDAESILLKTKDLEWMKDVRIEAVEICKMGAKKVMGSDGRPTGDEKYEVEAAVPLI